MQAGFIKMLVSGLLIFAGLSSCSIIDESDCRLNYIGYRYLNSVGELATSPYLFKVTDFVFTKDSVLYRVDENIVNGKIAKRPITLPNGEWIIYSYANLTGGSKVGNYVIGQTRLSEMSIRVASTPTYTGTYAPGNGAPVLRVGDADRLYFGKVALEVQDGYTKHTQLVDMSNIHIWLSGTVQWAKGAFPSTASDANLHIRLEYVPVEFGFGNDDKMDQLYKIPYSTPRTTTELATYSTALNATEIDGQYAFQMYGLRWEAGNAPMLRIYDGETPLVHKDLALNKFFEEQRIDLSFTRVQFYNLQIKVELDGIVTIADLGISDWEDGGDVEW